MSRIYKLDHTIKVLTDFGFDISEVRNGIFHVKTPEGYDVSKGCVATNLVQMSVVLESAIEKLRRPEPPKDKEKKAAALLRAQADVLYNSYTHAGVWPEGFEAEELQHNTLIEAAENLEK